jgi:hypothetical protein
MAFDVINIGTIPNDGTGDPLRTAFDKTNDNFALAVEGPASATSAAVAAFDGTTGKLLQNGNALAVTAGKFVPTANTVAGNGVYLPAANTLAFSTAGAERMRITSAGDVGIGTTTPLTKLGIVGKDTNGTTIRLFADQGGSIGNANGTSVTTSAVTVISLAGASGRLWVVNGDEGEDRFCDLILASTAAPPVVVQSFTARGAPAARTYTRSGSAIQLQMASGTYNVQAIGIGRPS